MGLNPLNSAKLDHAISAVVILTALIVCGLNGLRVSPRAGFFNLAMVSLALYHATHLRRQARTIQQLKK